MSMRAKRLGLAQESLRRRAHGELVLDGAEVDVGHAAATV
jgi:hypothetical protein